MEIEKINIYNCLRDFNVPAAILDDIFAMKKDLDILINSWRKLKATGLKQDEVAEKISKLILSEVGIDTNHDPVKK